MPLRRGGARRTGFTLIELLIVVVLFVLLATIALVQLSRARLVTQEQIALSSLRLVARSCQFYYLVNGRYPNALSTLGPGVSNPPYLDATLAQDPATKQGYQFTYSQITDVSFDLNADPVPGSIGGRHFFIDHSHTVHVNPDAPATASDPVLP